MAYDAVIFDNDGTLVTPTDPDCWRTATRLAFQDLGVRDLPPDLSRLDGYSVTALVRACAERGVDVEAFWQRREAYACLAQRYDVRAGTKTTYDDVGVLADLPVPVGVVSNNQQATVDFVVSYFDLGSAVRTCYGREPCVDGLLRMKPNPHYLRRAVRDLEATNPLYVGDSRADLAAAAALGVDAAFVRRPHRKGYEARPAPTHDVTSLEELASLCEAPLVA